MFFTYIYINFFNMKNKILILVIISSFLLSLTLLSCSEEEINYTTVSGKVERAINSEGIPNQKVLLEIKKSHGSGYFAYTTTLDIKEVITDSNGFFSTTMKTDSNTFVSVYKPQDEDYTSYELANFSLNQNIILKINKFIKFKIFVNNNNPFDVSDYIYINFFSGNIQNFRASIVNFGIQNTQYPEEILPGGGTIGAHEDASWKGTNVNSIVNYNVPENATDYKIIWNKRKNGIVTNGFTNDIPFQLNQINEYYFNY